MRFISTEDFAGKIPEQIFQEMNQDERTGAGKIIMLLTDYVIRCEEANKDMIEIISLLCEATGMKIQIKGLQND